MRFESPSRIPSSRGRTLALAGLFVLVAFGAGRASAQTTVDDFSVVQAAVTPASNATASASVAAGLGGERDLTVTEDGGGTASAAVAGGVLTYTQDTAGILELQYDGVDGSGTLDPTGLGGLDFTAGGTLNAISISGSSTGSFSTTIEVFTDGSNSSTFTFTFDGTTPDPFVVPFECFSANLGAGADFTDVGALVLTFDEDGGGAPTLTLDAITLVQCVTATMDDGLDITTDGLCPGDALVYTVTITNTATSGCDVTDIRFTLDPFSTNTEFSNSSTSTTGSVGAITLTETPPTALTVDIESLGGGSIVTITVNATISSPLATPAFTVTNQGVVETEFGSGTPIAPVTFMTDDPESAAADDATVTNLNPIISGVVWHDLNADGIRQGGEPPVDGTVDMDVTVALLDFGGGVVVAAAPVDASGAYMFCQPAGDYIVQFAFDDTMTYQFFTDQDVGADTTDSDADPDPVSATFGQTAVFTTVFGADTSNVDAGLLQEAFLSGMVFDDDNDNGQFNDPPELGVGGITVNLYDSTGVTLLDTTTSAGDGTYAFPSGGMLTSLRPGQYIVEFDPTTLPAGFAFTLRNVGSDLTDSDPDRTTGRTAVIDLDSAEADDTVFAGLTDSTDLRLTKSVSNATPANGDTVTFTVTIQNLGFADATTVVVTDDLGGSGLTAMPAVPTQGTFDETTGVWDVGTLLAGATATLVYDAVVDFIVGGTAITNTVTFTADNNDTNPANDTDSATVLAVGDSIKIESASVTLDFNKRLLQGKGDFVDSYIVRGKLSLAALTAQGINLFQLGGYIVTVEFPAPGAYPDPDTAIWLATPMRVTPTTVVWRSPPAAQPNLTVTVNKLTGAFTVVARNVALQEIMELYAGATLKRGVGSRAVAMSLNDPLTAPLTLDAVPFRLTFGTDPTLTQFIFQGVTEIGMTYSIRRANTVGKAAYQFGKTGTPPTPFTFIDSASLAQRRLPGDVYVSQLRATLCLVPDPLNTNTDPYDPTDPASTMDITVGGLALFNLVNTNFTGRNGNFTARNPAPGLLSVTFNNQTYKLTLVTDWLDPLANFGVEPVVDSRGDAPFSRQSIYFPIQVDLDTTDTHFATVLLGRQGTTFKTATPTVVFPPAP